MWPSLPPQDLSSPTPSPRLIPCRFELIVEQPRYHFLICSVFEFTIFLMMLPGLGVNPPTSAGHSTPWYFWRAAASPLNVFNPHFLFLPTSDIHPRGLPLPFSVPFFPLPGRGFSTRTSTSFLEQVNHDTSFPVSPAFFSSSGICFLPPPPFLVFLFPGVGTRGTVALCFPPSFPDCSLPFLSTAANVREWFSGARSLPKSTVLPFSSRLNPPFRNRPDLLFFLRFCPFNCRRVSAGSFLYLCRGRGFS